MPPIAHFLLALRELCFPLCCIACHCKIMPGTKIHLCSDCRSKIEHIQNPLCSCCGKEFPNYSGDSHRCAACIKQPPPYSKARAILRYNEDLAPIIHAFKYQGKTIGRSTFAALKVQSTVLEDLAIADYIIPVPLHIKRLRKRGFNQALLLANIFFPLDKKKIRSDLIMRHRYTEPQAKLNGRERRRNLKNAFRLNEPAAIQDKTFLLVDDVFTTGTTLIECARVLKNGGAKNVEALTFARVGG